MREESSTRFNPYALLISVTNVEALLGVKFNSHDIGTFSKSVVEWKYVDIFSKMSFDEIDAVADAIETIAKKFSVGDDNSRPNVTKQVVEPNHDDLIVHDVNINTKSTSYARAAGANHKVNSEVDLVDVVTIGIPSLTGDDFIKETIRIEYEWRHPRCDACKIFGHVHDQCPKLVMSHPISVTSTIEKNNDGFQKVGNKKKKKGQSKSNNGSQLVGLSVKQNLRYEPKAAATSEPKKGATNVGNTSKLSSMVKSTSNSAKKGNITASNSYSALENDEEDEEHVENAYDESANLFLNSKPGESSTFTVAAG
uniref:Zinc knuckle CX2CX4HX4C n=1 Tax=Tanacetum cinerariifolium TaxID=118510 RepID=A0A6L2M1Q8_TANCI|nr:zinc knuckle CX2CX4HX4C [Tanacetum cinerariifolium]